MKHFFQCLSFVYKKIVEGFYQVKFSIKIQEFLKQQQERILKNKSKSVKKSRNKACKIYLKTWKYRWHITGAKINH